MGREIVSQGNIYIIVLINGVDSYDWSVLLGVEILLGQGINQVIIVLDVIFMEGEICVMVENDCGLGVLICFDIFL